MALQNDEIPQNDEKIEIWASKNVVQNFFMIWKNMLPIVAYC